MLAGCSATFPVPLVLHPLRSLCRHCPLPGCPANAFRVPMSPSPQAALLAHLLHRTDSAVPGRPAHAPVWPRAAGGRLCLLAGVAAVVASQPYPPLICPVKNTPSPCAARFPHRLLSPLTTPSYSASLPRFRATSRRSASRSLPPTAPSRVALRTETLATCQRWGGEGGIRRSVVGLVLCSAVAWCCHG